MDSFATEVMNLLTNVLGKCALTKTCCLIMAVHNMNININKIMSGEALTPLSGLI